MHFRLEWLDRSCQWRSKRKGTEEQRRMREKLNSQPELKEEFLRKERER